MILREEAAAFAPRWPAAKQLYSLAQERGPFMGKSLTAAVFYRRQKQPEQHPPFSTPSLCQIRESTFPETFGIVASPPTSIRPTRFKIRESRLPHLTQRTCRIWRIFQLNVGPVNSISY
jgi:hypothetical protein